MSRQYYPSFWIYKDECAEWRWTFDASKGRTIAVSPRGYPRRIDCERSIELLRASEFSPVYFPPYLAYA